MTVSACICRAGSMRNKRRHAVCKKVFCNTAASSRQCYILRTPFCKGACGSQTCVFPATNVYTRHSSYALTKPQNKCNVNLNPAPPAAGAAAAAGASSSSSDRSIVPSTLCECDDLLHENSNNKLVHIDHKNSNRKSVAYCYICVGVYAKGI